MAKLKILNIATTDSGGAGFASLYFNELLNKFGYRSLLIVKLSKATNNNVITLNKSPFINMKHFFHRIIKRIRKFLIPADNSMLKYCFFNAKETKSYCTTKEILDSIPFFPDVIFIHWISNFINAKTIREIAEETNAKIFWIAMDNAPLTGGCHYPWDCRGFKTDCSDCPALFEHSNGNIATKNLAFKKKYLPDNIELIVGSETDYQRAKQSSIFKKKLVHQIFFPVDDNKYIPSDKYKAKQFFGIDCNKKTILYGTLSLYDQRKGGKYFIEALTSLQDFLKKKKKSFSDFVVMVAGKGEDKNFDNISMAVKMIGHLDEVDLIKAYQSADVFVSSSLEDSGPLMINQSIMCGTPVVSFDTGVAKDLIINGQTGYRARNYNIDEMAKGIYKILEMSDKEYNQLSSNCRELALKTFSTDVIKMKFFNLLSKSQFQNDANRL